MPQTTLTLSPVSPAIRHFVEYDKHFLLSGHPLKIALFGRVLRLTVSLLLHAYAVEKAICICFLYIKNQFSKSHGELIKAQKEECVSAYRTSVQLFFSCFSLKILPRLTIAEPIVPPREVPLEKITQAEPPAPLQIPQSTSVTPSEGAPPQPPLLLLSPPPQPSSPNLPPNPPPLRPQPSPLVLSSRPSSPTPTTPSQRLQNSLSQSSPGFSLPPSSFHQVEESQEEDSFVNLYPSPQRSGEASPQADSISLDLTEQERLRIQQARERARLYHTGIQQEQRRRNREEIEEAIGKESRMAQTQIDEPRGVLTWLDSSKQSDNNGQLTSDERRINSYLFSTCQYRPLAHSLETETTAFTLPVEYGGQNHLLHVLGIFEPHRGPRAALHLKNNFSSVFGEKIQELGLSDEGIYNVFIETFYKLNLTFNAKYRDKKIDPSMDSVIATDGSSATIVMIYGNTLWTAHLGKSRAILNLEGAPIQLSCDPNVELFKHRIEGLGGYVENGLVNGIVPMATGIGFADLNGAIGIRPGITRQSLDKIGENSHLVLGSQAVFETVSTQNVVAWLRDNRQKEVQPLACDLLCSIHTENQKHDLLQQKEKPLYCLIVKLGNAPPQEEKKEGLREEKKEEKPPAGDIDDDYAITTPLSGSLFGSPAVMVTPPTEIAKDPLDL